MEVNFKDIVIPVYYIVGDKGKIIIDEDSIKEELDTILDKLNDEVTQLNQE